jgi:hypothetical protein
LRDLEVLRRKGVRAPEPRPALIYALWGRAGIREEVRRAGAQGFDLAVMLKG